MVIGDFTANSSLGMLIRIHLCLQRIVYFNLMELSVVMAIEVPRKVLSPVTTITILALLGMMGACTIRMIDQEAGLIVISDILENMV